MGRRMLIHNAGFVDDRLTESIGRPTTSRPIVTTLEESTTVSGRRKGTGTGDNAVSAHRGIAHAQGEIRRSEHIERVGMISGR